MEKCDEIWEFIEKKLNCTVPQYIINVLKACGYDNAITIGTIEEDDVQYFEKQVRDGYVTKFYEEMGATSILAGSTKTEENFEFSRGHKKFLIIISDFLKKYSKENVSDAVILPLKILSETKKKTIDLSSTLKVPNKNEKDLHNAVTNLDMNLHQGILTCKIITSLIHIIPAMYAQNMDSINKKIANDLVKIKVNGENLSVSEAVIYCPFCSTTTCAFHRSSEDKFSWNVSYFEVHLENAHRDESEYIEEKTISRPFEDQCPLSMSAVEHLKKDTNSEPDGFLSNNPTHKDFSSVRLPDSSAEKDLSYSEILKAPYMGKFEFEPEKMISTSTKIEEIVGTNETLGRDNKERSITPELGNFVICLLLVKDTIKWPSNTSITKHFVGKICQRNDNVSNAKDNELSDESFDIQLLIKKQNSNYIFYYPEQFETRKIPGGKIVKILPDPVVNRRGALVFKDRSILDYVF